MKLRAGLVCAAWLVLTPLFAAGQRISVWSGVYTAAEAEAGEKIYFARCSSCHGNELEGREQASALAGPQFLDGWHGRDLRQLLDRIKTMPPADPSAHTGRSPS